MAQVDCSKLDPRAFVSREMEGKVKASVDTLYKIAKAGGSVEGKIKDEIQNLQKGAPVTEQGQIKLRTLYLFCGMVANARDISTDRKVELFKIMMEEKKADKPEARRSVQKKKSKPSQPSKAVATPPRDEQKITTPQNNPQPNPQTNDSVSSQGQSGGITAQNVTIIRNESEKAPSKGTAKSQPKLPPTTAELEQNLREQIGFLRSSTAHFDQGRESEAKRIASSLYILFVNTGDSPSLLEQMRIRDEIRLPDTAYGDVEGNLAPYMGLVAMKSANYIARQLAFPEDRQFKNIPFQEWWRKVILDNHKGLVYTREALVIAVAEQDGGIKVASGLDPSYVELARKNGIGWRRECNGGDKPMLGVELHSIREIAWELLDAISRQYPQYLRD